jgi:uncharacterized membrane protein YccC
VRELVRVAPARLEPGPLIRGILAVGVPLTIGVLVGQPAIFMLSALGGLFAIVGNTGGTVGAQFRQLGFEGLAAATGYAIGQLMLGHALAAIIVVPVLTLLSTVFSILGSTWSLGGMLLLVMLIGGSSVPNTGPIGLGSVVLLCGTGFAIVLLGAESLIDRRRPVRAAVSGVLSALARLATTIERDPTADIDSDRDALISASDAAWAQLLGHRSQLHGRTSATDRGAAVLAALAKVSPAMLAAREANRFPSGTAAWLTACASAIEHRAPAPAIPANLAVLADRHGLDAPDGLLVRSVQGLMDAVRGRSTTLREGAVVSLPRPTLAQRFGVLLGTDVWLVGVRGALCAVVAMVLIHVVPGERSYWIPITVIMVFKPDFGSVFARAVQRSVGTIVGAAAGAVILTVLPKGLLLVAIIAVCAGLLPWVAKRSFALVGAVLTPLVLVLFDLAVPAAGTTDYWMQRTIDTIIGSAIVIVLGYLIWPRRMRFRFATPFAALLSALADFELATNSAMAIEAPGQLAGLRRQVYRKLADVRVQLQRAMSEPPPANGDAVAWFPAAESASRLSDAISVEAVRRSGGEPPAPDANAIAGRLRMLASDPDREPEGSTTTASHSESQQTPHSVIGDEVDTLESLLVRQP